MVVSHLTHAPGWFFHTVTYPLDLIRTRLSAQTHEGRYTSIRQTAIHVVKSEGVLGLYRGILPTLMGIAPYVGLNFTVYESLRAYVPVDEDGNLDTVWKLAGALVQWAANSCCALIPLLYRYTTAGGRAGAVSQTVSYPLDVLRRRFQMSGLAGNKQYSGLGDAVRTILKEEGMLGFYKGITANYMKVAPSVAAQFVVYEFVRDFLAQHV